MADIQEKILGKYDIDIDKENILKLYKIENPDLSGAELDALIEKAHKRWMQSINGANEKIAERDRLRLEKADKYEAVLKDTKLRKAVFDYYKGGGQKSKTASGEGSKGDTSFARDYFKLIETSKKIRKEDVQFFFDYYQSERKNKKAILEMLEKEFKVRALGKEEKYASEDDDKDLDGKKKDESSPLIVNLFQEATILKLRKCADLYEKALQSPEICQAYPTISESLYDFLELKQIYNIQQFSEYISAKSKEAYSIRQEKGIEYLPIVDLFNTLQAMVSYRDVVDNFPEIKLLIKYPSLTPYMYSFTEMKPNTLKGIISVADREYAFRDDADFILNYYNPVHDNFGITNSGIGNIIKKAEKKAKQNEILNSIDERLGIRRKKHELPLWAEIIHGLVYWPIFLMYFVFEVFKTVFGFMPMLAIPVFVIGFIAENIILPRAMDVENVLYLAKIFNKAQWLEYIRESEKIIPANTFEAIVISLYAIVLLLAVYCLPPLFISLFVSKFAGKLNSTFDWVGYERTFKSILQKIKAKTVDLYNNKRKLFVKRRLQDAAVNLICTALVAAIIIFTPKGFNLFSEKTGYFQKAEVVLAEEGVTNDLTEAPETPKLDYVMVIIVSEANIRSGPGTENSSIAVAKEGDEFIPTGNEETAPNGRIWYEIYLDENMDQTGWASQKVIAIKQD